MVRYLKQSDCTVSGAKAAIVTIFGFFLIILDVQVFAVDQAVINCNDKACLVFAG
jgi:hypothetical protein